MKDYLPLIGTIVGAGLALLGVWLVQIRTDKRDKARLDREREVDLERYARTKADRLRERRVNLYLDIAAFMHLQLWVDDMFLPGIGTPDSIATAVGALYERMTPLQPRIQLLAPAEFVAQWAVFQARISDFINPEATHRIYNRANKDHPVTADEWNDMTLVSMGEATDRINALLREAMDEVDTL